MYFINHLDLLTVPGLFGVLPVFPIFLNLLLNNGLLATFARDYLLDVVEVVDEAEKALLGALEESFFLLLFDFFIEWLVDVLSPTFLCLLLFFFLCFFQHFQLEVFVDALHLKSRRVELECYDPG